MFPFSVIPVLLTVTTEWRAVICLTCTLVQKNVCYAVGPYSFIHLLVCTMSLRSLYQLQNMGHVCLPENKFTWRIISQRKKLGMFLTQPWLAPRDCHVPSAEANWWRPQIQRWSRSDSSCDFLSDNTEYELLWRGNRTLSRDLSDPSVIGGTMCVSSGNAVQLNLQKVKVLCMPWRHVGGEQTYTSTCS